MQCHFLFLAVFHQDPPHRFASPSHAVYFDAYRLLALSLLPYLKNRIGNLQSCILACTITTSPEQDLRGHCQSKKCKQCGCPLVTEIFAKLVTAFSSSYAVSESYCCTFEHRTSMTTPLAEIPRCSYKHRHLRNVMNQSFRLVDDKDTQV
jgi:hypothetical protein